MVSPDLEAAVARIRAISPNWRLAISGPVKLRGASLVAEHPNPDGHLLIELFGFDDRPGDEQVRRIKVVIPEQYQKPWKWYAWLHIRQMSGAPPAPKGSSGVDIFKTEATAEWMVARSLFSGNRLKVKTEPTDDLVYLFNLILEISEPLYRAEFERVERSKNDQAAAENRLRDRFWSGSH